MVACIRITFIHFMLRFILFLCVSVPVYSMYVLVSQEARGIGSPAAGFPGRCELPDFGARNKTQVLVVRNTCA